MPFRISPLEEGYRAHFDADSVTSAYVPINGYFGSMYAQLLRRLNRSPHVMTIMLVYDFSVFLKIRVNRQTLFTYQ
jgi:hypothetical protein